MSYVFCQPQYFFHFQTNHQQCIIPFIKPKKKILKKRKKITKTKLDQTSMIKIIKDKSSLEYSFDDKIIDFTKYCTPVYLLSRGCNLVISYKILITFFFKRYRRDKYSDVFILSKSKIIYFGILLYKHCQNHVTSEKQS